MHSAMWERANYDVSVDVGGSTVTIVIEGDMIGDELRDLLNKDKALAFIDARITQMERELAEMKELRAAAQDVANVRVFLDDEAGRRVRVDDGSDDVYDEVDYLPVEFDVSYSGGDYGGSGTTAAIPSTVIDKHQSVEDAFEAYTGVDRQHIVHYSNEYFDAEEFEQHYGFDPSVCKTEPY